MAVDFDNLFTKLGKIFFYQESINTARGTTIPPLAKAILDAFDGDSLELKKAIEGIEASQESFQQGASGAMAAAKTAAKNVIVETLQADAALDAKDETTALIALIARMVTAGESVDASTAAASVAADGSNNGDGVMVVSAKRGDGKNQENMLAETIRCEITSDSTPSRATATCSGDAAELDALSQDWPGGSGVRATLPFTDAASSLLGNGDFDDFDDVANAPDEWIVSVGTIGTTVKGTSYEVQRIAITGTPSAGTYRVNWTNQAGKVQTTGPIAYDADQSTLQAALRLLSGLENVTVSSTGTSPDYTHDITFTGVAGNLTAVTVTNATTGGTFTITTPTQGSANAFIGKALEFDSDGSQLTSINRLVDLDPLTQYAFNLWALADVVPAAGVITVDLVDGIGGSVINDQAGTANSFTISCPGLSTSFAARNGVFRTPRVLPELVYLRIRISTAVSSGTSIFIDHAALVEMVELYPGGPFAAGFSGKTPLTKGTNQIAADGFTITTTNDRAGEFQEWFNRNFSMAAKGLMLPSNTGGSETQADSLIA